MAAKRQKTNVGPGWTNGKVDEIYYHHPWLHQVLGNDPSLTMLEVLHSDRISNAAAKALADALRTNTSLKRLVVAGDGITDEAGMVLAEALRVNKTIGTLSFESDSITDMTGVAMAEALRANVTLRSITIISRHPVTYFFKRPISGMFTAMSETDSEDGSKHQKGKRGKQQRQWMTDRTVRAMAETIRVNNTLQRLEIGVSSICKDTTTAVAQALSVNKAVQHVFVNGQAITSTGPGPSPAQLNAQARRKATASLKKFEKQLRERNQKESNDYYLMRFGKPP